MHVEGVCVKEGGCVCVMGAGCDLKTLDWSGNTAIWLVS